MEMRAVENNTDVKQQELVLLLQREINHLQNLMHSLEEEYAALAEQHTATLEDVVRKKQATIRELEHIGQQRETMLVSMNTTTEEQLNEAVHASSTDHHLSALWNELVLLAEKCQEMNRINGSIVELVSRQSRHALEILHGISPNLSSRPELYDQTGYKIISGETHSLTKA
ncbi:MAG: flagellar protein FlgN [Gammaproteobacteria bacterium]|jgi:flagellar biosynthesis/type III secretory pathway chaperone